MCQMLISPIFLKRPLVFPILFFFPLFLCIVHLRRSSYLSFLFSGTLFIYIYLFISPLPFSLLLFSAIHKTSLDNCFVFLHFFFPLGAVLITASGTILLTSIHSSSGTLPTRANPLNLSVTSTVWELISTVTSMSCFCWLYRAYPSLAEKNVISLISVLTIWWYSYVELYFALLEKVACCQAREQCVLLTKLCYPLPCFILYSKAKLACYSGYLLTSYFYIPISHDEKGIFFGVSSRRCCMSSYNLSTLASLALMVGA